MSIESVESVPLQDLEHTLCTLTTCASDSGLLYYLELVGVLSSIPRDAIDDCWFGVIFEKPRLSRSHWVGELCFSREACLLRMMIRLSFVRAESVRCGGASWIVVGRVL